MDFPRRKINLKNDFSETMTIKILPRIKFYNYIFWCLGAFLGQTEKAEVRPSSAEISNLNYLCQYCLVHLGDLARYRNQPQQAETFYRLAIQLAPGNGQAYNQVPVAWLMAVPLVKT